MPNQPFSSNAPKQRIPDKNTQESPNHDLPIINLVESRHNQITLIKQLLQLVRAVQLHRGMTMSVLAGGKTFVNEIVNLQSNLSLRLSLIESMMERSDVTIPDVDKEKLHHAWQTILHDWEGDKLIDNFELHSHYISQLNEMIKDMALAITKPLAEVVDDMKETQPGHTDYGYPLLFKNIELMNFISYQLPTMIEIFAKLRGLASYAATLGEVDTLQESKLRYLLNDAKEHHEKTRLQAKRLQDIWQGQMVSIKQIANIELKVLYLFTTIEKDILASKKINVEAHHFFKLASEVIDTYGEIGEDGWTLARRQVDRDLESWVSLQGNSQRLQ